MIMINKNKRRKKMIILLIYCDALFVYKYQPSQASCLFLRNILRLKAKAS